RGCAAQAAETGNLRSRADRWPAWLPKSDRRLVLYRQGFEDRRPGGDRRPAYLDMRAAGQLPARRAGLDADRGDGARRSVAETGQLDTQQRVEEAALCAQSQPRDLGAGEIRVWPGLVDQGQFFFTA